MQNKENEESSTVLETFENAEENTNVEEESADDEIEERWRPINEQPLHKKGQGRTIHISDFLTETIGQLRLLDEQISNVDENFPKDAQVKICPGKNQDGWWNLEQLIDQ
ncbi:69_t:CDS:2, partial [Entrophospora sp. SA101]